MTSGAEEQKHKTQQAAKIPLSINDSHFRHISATWQTIGNIFNNIKLPLLEQAKSTWDAMPGSQWSPFPSASFLDSYRNAYSNK